MHGAVHDEALPKRDDELFGPDNHRSPYPWRLIPCDERDERCQGACSDEVFLTRPKGVRRKESGFGLENDRLGNEEGEELAQVS